MSSRSRSPALEKPARRSRSRSRSRSPARRSPARRSPARAPRRTERKVEPRLSQEEVHAIGSKIFSGETFNLFVGKLPSNATSEDLLEPFQGLSGIHETKVVLDKKGASREYGFVYFLTEKSRAEAMEKVGTDCRIKGQEVKVSLSDNKNELILTNGPPELTVERVTTWVKDQSGCDPHAVEIEQNCAIISFTNFQQSAHVLDSLSGLQFDGHTIILRPCRDKAKQVEKAVRARRDSGQRSNHGGDEDEEDIPTVFVKNLPEGTTIEALQEHFAQIGTVLAARVVNRKAGKTSPPMTYGFVEFQKAADAAEAVANWDGKEWKGSVLHVAVAQSRKKARESARAPVRRRRGGRSRRSRSRSRSWSRGRSPVRGGRRAPRRRSYSRSRSRSFDRERRGRRERRRYDSRSRSRSRDRGYERRRRYDSRDRSRSRDRGYTHTRRRYNSRSRSRSH